MPKHVIDEKGNEWVEAENIVTNGPYVLTEWTHDQQIVVEANQSYFGEKPTVTKGILPYCTKTSRLNPTHRSRTMSSTTQTPGGA